MQKTAPKSIKTNNVKIQEYHNLTKIGPSPKCFEGSISKHLGHLSVLEKTGQMSSAEISKTKKKIIE